VACLVVNTGLTVRTRKVEYELGQRTGRGVENHVSDIRARCRLAVLDQYNLNAYSLFNSEDTLMETLAERGRRIARRVRERDKAIEAEAASEEASSGDQPVS